MNKSSNFIFVKGAREHNLKDVDVKIPRNKLVVMTGVSGSGKSSLAFDTIYAEGQRRYIESLSSYARQFLGQTNKPDVDYIDGLSPAVSIDQKAVSKNPRSTVGTVTEIYDYLRVLFARIGKAYCPIDGKPVKSYSIDEIVDFIFSVIEDGKISILAPVVRNRKGDYLTLAKNFAAQGYSVAYVDGRKIDLEKSQRLERYKNHNIELVIDEIILKSAKENIQDDQKRTRLAEAVESSVKLADGLVLVKKSDGESVEFSTKFSCPEGHSFSELEPRLFSFNSPIGACDKCGGIGYQLEIDSQLIMPDKNKTISEGAILPWSYSPTNYYGAIIKAVAQDRALSLSTPVKNLPKEDIDYFLFGSGRTERIPVTYFSRGQTFRLNFSFDGVVNLLQRRFNKTESDAVREDITKYMSRMTCETCFGKRLNSQALSVKIGDLNINEVVSKSIIDSVKFFEQLDLNKNEQIIAERLLKEILSRLKFLRDVGLGYLTLDRYASTLSGGETQRIRLASQIGSGLVGVLYVLDEPSIGLHQRDNRNLLQTLKGLRDLGNTVIVIEHDEETIRSADYIIDIGPGAGVRGGEIVGQGSVNDLEKSESSLTGKYLKGELKINTPAMRRKMTGNYVTIKGGKEHNLKNITVRFPLGQFVVVTGVSGSGKSTLVNDILYKGLAREIYKGWDRPGKFSQIEGAEFVDKIIDVDQSPIGRTPRSNPVTYIKAFDGIRQIFAAIPEAKIRGYKPGRFSFNVSSAKGGGRCERCQGDGVLKIEMHFLPDVYLPCDICNGKRYNRETLEVKYKDKNIHNVLEMTVDEATEFFQNIPSVIDKIKTLQEVGLGYIKLGQSATTLSGGEAQRVKLSLELSKRQTGKTLYILDEPTTGLHFDDVKKLLEVLDRLVDSGNTVVMIEHNLDVIKTADYIIDLGPEGGNAGGKIVAAGTPEMVSGIKNSFTGQYLKKVLSRKI
ncbi:excinuclease ABC subunit UvrA [Candidatus Berkelbacteria bacterium CG10_big_fil_rev_8_21_14_0_10_41_12]|uniref:UvrABC system protein A n=1 Tax=Candidatus Berkelbacteria bacterium CG10_big_fil_rev_8_21_14_0_10_41_12 TaxID=1974513 RepID=A0A2M6WWF1_9BACT|nr:MAG: excinuclease ABC subunit UvrA [Candidatus Berkelbacteria bacterium CG10_big_fil_rev_8_21_14_0_10_41_12]